MIGAHDPDGGAQEAGQTPRSVDRTRIVLIGDAQAEVGPAAQVTLDCIDGAVWIANTGHPGIALVAGESLAWREPEALLRQSLAAFTRVRVRPYRSGSGARYRRRLESGLCRDRPMTPSPASLSWRDRLRRLIEHPATQRIVIVLILVNAVALGLETSDTVMAQVGPALLALDRAILALFVVEIAVRLAVHRTAFFRDPWSVFDLIVVGIALMPATGALSVLRALRVLRVMRLLTVVPSMRRVVGALLSAIPGLGSIGMVLGLIFYVFGVIATKLFGDTHPDWFGTLGHSLYTLFQVMTLESWSMGISRPVMETYPYAWVFFIPFILVATFTMLNLFIAVIVSAMQTFTESDAEETRATVERARDHVEADLHAEMRSLRGEIAELKALLGRQASAARGTAEPGGT